MNSSVIGGPTPPTSGGLLTLVRAEQARRWRGGERPPAEEFLSRHPDLADDPDAMQVVVYGEALLREELDGTPPDPAEYAARFPELATALNRQFELHEALCPPARPDLPGFEIVRELGRGGAGVVFLAREAALDRLVAVKVLLSGEFASAAARRRFRTEAEAAARLRHPHIVAVHAVGEFAGRAYVVFEYVAGGSLDRRLAGTPLEPRVAAELIRPLAEAVQHAHDRGIVHRDLKPGNVLLVGDDIASPLSRLCGRGAGGEGSVRNSQQPKTLTPNPSPAEPGEGNSNPLLSAKIADFGLARRLDLDDGPTMTSQVLGTPSYMAPEQASGAKDAGRAADIYALGAILYECLTGRPPFKAATSLETLAHVTRREPAVPRSLNPAVPRDLETICLKCLAKEPAKRYATAGALADDLGRFLGGRPVLARPVGPAGRAWRWAKRRPAVAGLAAALAVLLPAALATTTALYLRAERRGRESLTYRVEAVERMSRLAIAQSGTRDVASSIELHRACAAEFERLAEAGVDPPGSRLRRADHVAWMAFDLLREGHDYSAALAVAEEAIAAFDRCLSERPNSTPARQGLFEARFRRATSVRRLERWAEALALLDELVAQAPAVYGPDESRNTKLRTTLRDLHHDRGSALYYLGRYPESAAAYDEALRLDDGTTWVDLTILRAGLHARSGRAAEAVVTVQAQLTNPHLSAWNVFNAGCVYALASVAEDLPAAARAAAAEAAVATLRRAFAANPSLRTAVSREPDLRPLQSRPDFQALLAGR